MVIVSPLRRSVVFYLQKTKWLSEPIAKDLSYPINSLIFVIESQVVFTHIFMAKEASSHIYFTLEETYF